MSVDVAFRFDHVTLFDRDRDDYDDVTDDVVNVSMPGAIIETETGSNLPAATTNDVDDDSDLYDTDLENDVTSTKCSSSIEAPVIRAYTNLCQRNSTVPQTTIRRGLQEPEISIRHRSLGTRDMTSLAISLCQNQDVEKLDLAGNCLEGSGAMYIRTALAVNPNITTLDLSDNKLGNTPEGAIAIGEMIRFNKGLIRLNLSGNNFRDPDSPHIAAGISVNDRMIELDLSHNDFGEIGGMNLGRAIATNDSLYRLNLSWNSICRKGAVAICKGLQANTTLVQINLSRNGFGYEGSLALAELLRKNTPLVELDVSSNRINWQGAAFISKGLSKNKTLEVLKLDNNPLTTTGCMDIIESINNQDSALQTLGLKGIPVIGEFNLTVMMIKDRRRDFQVEHGGFVNSHDVIGQRLDKRVTPIQKVMNFMKDREYRPTELFRMLDKNVTNGMDNEEIMHRLAKVGLHLHKHEMEELTEYLQRASHPNLDPDQVNFKKMAGGMKTHIERKRLDLMRQMEGEQKLKQLHKKILSHDLNTATGLPSSESTGTAFPPIGAPSTHNGTNSIRTTSRMSKVSFGGPGIRGVEEDSDYDEEEERRKALAAQAEAMLSGRMANMGVDPAAERRREPSLLQFGIPKKVKIMSMSTKLGGKSKSFGEAGRKKKKTKKKKK